MRNAISFRTDYQNASAWGGQDDPLVEFMLCGEFFLIRESLDTWVSSQVEEWKFDPRFTRADHVDVLLDRDVIAELNDHHVAEAAFKALGRALRVACEADPRREGVASTKGTLG